MSRWLLRPATLATVLGLALAIWTIGRLGAREIGGIVARVGVWGFLLFVTSYLLVLVVLGAAWAVSMRNRAPHPIRLFVWARTVREAAGDLLPFSQVGGLLFGLRVLIRAGISPARASAAAIVDLTTELASQLLLVLAGLLIGGLLLSGSPGMARMQSAAWIGTLATALITLAMIVLQRPALALASRLAARLLPAAEQTIDAVKLELQAFSRRPAAMLPSFLCNALAWLMAVFSAWLGLTLLGADVPPLRVLALEAIVFALRGCAFFLPGAIGVQEASYALLGPLFGIDREVALALSLLKRARDVTIGLPTLLLHNAIRFRGTPPEIGPGSR